MTRCVAVTGDLDPIGGHFLRHKADWAYMSIQRTRDGLELVDPQTLVGTDERGAELC